MRPMTKETHIKTDKKTVGGWGAWELPIINVTKPTVENLNPIPVETMIHAIKSLKV